MTPKEKAKELVDKFVGYAYDGISEAEYNAIAIALIAVDEILNELDDIMNFEASRLSLKMIKYWKQVKEEIEKI